VHLRGHVAGMNRPLAVLGKGRKENKKGCNRKKRKKIKWEMQYWNIVKKISQ